MDSRQDATHFPSSESEPAGGPSDRLIRIGIGGVVAWVAIGILAQIAGAGGILP